MSRKILYGNVDEKTLTMLSARYRDYQWALFSLYLAVEEHFASRKKMQRAFYQAKYVAGHASVPYEVLYNMHRKVTRIKKEKKINTEEAIRYIVYEAFKLEERDEKQKHHVTP